MARRELVEKAGTDVQVLLDKLKKADMPQLTTRYYYRLSGEHRGLGAVSKKSRQRAIKKHARYVSYRWLGSCPATSHIWRESTSAFGEA